MRKTLFSLLLMAAAGAHATPSESTQRLVFDNGSTCTGVAIGPNTMLTALHCLPETYTQMTVGGLAPRVLLRTNDRTDHVIFVFAEPIFKTWSNPRAVAPEQAEELTVWGYPANHTTQQYRRLTVSGVDEPMTMQTGAYVYSLDGNVFFGDSGGGAFDAQGNLVCLITSMVFHEHQSVRWVYPTCNAWTFTREQMDEVRRYANGQVQI